MLPRIIFYLGCLLLMQTFALSQDVFAQELESAETTAQSTTAQSTPAETVSETQAADSAEPEVAKTATNKETPPVEPQPPEPFKLPNQHHTWARFKPGAWREIQTMSATLDDQGNLSEQNFTTQKETLDAVADGKYVLKVQTTVELGGKQFVGKETTRVLHLETDGAGPLVETTRLDDQTLSLTGRDLDCQVWELHYQNGDRSLQDMVHYTKGRFPHIVRRETITADAMPAEGSLPVAESQPTEEPQPLSAEPKDNPRQIEQTVEVIALETPYTFNQQILNCTSMRTVRQRAKGGSVRLATIHSEIPGGELLVKTTEFDAAGNSLRFSATTLLGYGGERIEEAPDAEPETTALEPAVQPKNPSKTP